MECLSNSQQEQDFDFMTNFTVWVYFDSKKIGYLTIKCFCELRRGTTF